MKAYSVVILLLLQVLIYLSASFVFCKHALLMFQQNRYELYRYSKWLFNRRNIYEKIEMLVKMTLIKNKH